MTPLPAFLPAFRFQLFRAWRSFPALVAAGLLTLLQATAWAQAPQAGPYTDPPGRVARLNLMEGDVSLSPADIAGTQDASAWTPATLNRPLTRGDRLWTGPRARAELHIGSTAVRMNEQTSLDFWALDDDVVQLRLAQGTLRLRVRTLFEGQRLEINTPNLAFVVSQPGDYRLDANPATDTTRVVVHSGGGTVYGDSGTPVTLASQQQASFTGTQLTPGAPGSAVLDGFDLWALERDRREDQSISARYVPREVIGYQQLDLYGDWSQDPTYGAVWLPRAVPLHWAPYRMGHWSWIAPWGWTWIDDAPWGFAPCHYGRWALIGQRWAWVPGRLAPRPVYAPALVVFVGGSSGGVNWSLLFGSGGAPQPALGWFPLAPGEAFMPIYRVSPRYVTQVNQNIVVNNTVNVTNIYRYQRQPAAVTVVSADDFTRGRPVRGNPALNAAELSRAPVVVDQRTIPLRPDVQRPRLAAAAALPPAMIAAQPVVRGRGDRRDERRDDRRDEQRADDRRDGRTPSLPPPPPPSQGLINAQPPATRPAQIFPPAMQDRSAADAELRVRREQEQQQRDLARQQQEAQRRQSDESLMQRAQRERAERAAAERNAIDAEQRARREQQQQQLQQQLQREQAQQQRDLVRQQEAQRRQNEESLMQRAQRERAAAAAAAAERSAIEQSQRAQQQLQREQERQQRELIRQQEQQRRQNEELLGQRAMREQAQRQEQARQEQAQAQQRAQQAQQEQRRQAHEQQQLQQQPQEQRRDRTQQRQPARQADGTNGQQGQRPEGWPNRFREQ